MLYTIQSLLLAALLLLTAGQASAYDQSPIGVWQHPNGRIHLEIYPCADALCGRLVWLQRPNDETGRPRTDINNPTPALRSRPIIGMQVLTGLRRTADGSWEDGTAYNPDDGETYDTKMSIEPDGRLRTRGYVIMSLLGKTVLWTRVR
jgi:uncharacterized protein (DUF2147 family)